MGRTKRFLAGITAGYLNQALVMLIGFWITPFLLKHLGKHDYGLWLISLQVTAYLGLAEFGVIALLPRDLAKLTTQHPDAQTYLHIRHHLEDVASSILLQTVLVMLIAAVFWILLPKDWDSLRKPVGLTMLTFAILFPFRMLQATLEGLQRQAQLSLISTTAWLAGLALNISLIVHGWGLMSVAAGWALYQFALVLGCFSYLLVIYPAVLPRKVHWNGWHSIVHRFTRGYWLSLQQIAQILLNGTDLLIIGRSLGPSFTVAYSCSGKLSGAMSNQPGLLMQTAMPGLSQLKASQTTNRLREASLSLTMAMMILSGACAAVVLGINRSFVGVWVGMQQYSGFGVTLLFLILLMLRHLNLTFASMAFSFGHERRMCIFALVEGAVGFGLSIALTSYLGVSGVIIGPLIALCLTSLLSNALTVSSELKESPIAFLTPLWPWFWRFALTASIGCVVGNWWTPSTLPHVTILALGITVFYFALVIPVAMKSPLWQYMSPLITDSRSRLARFVNQSLPSSEPGYLEK